MGFSTNVPFMKQDVNMEEQEHIIKSSNHQIILFFDGGETEGVSMAAERSQEEEQGSCGWCNFTEQILQRDSDVLNDHCKLSNIRILKFWIWNRWSAHLFSGIGLIRLQEAAVARVVLQVPPDTLSKCPWWRHRTWWSWCLRHECVSRLAPCRY